MCASFWIWAVMHLSLAFLLCSCDALNQLWASLTQAFLELTKPQQRCIYLNQCDHVLEINFLNSHKSKCWCRRRWKWNLQRFGSKNAVLNICLHFEWAPDSLYGWSVLSKDRSWLYMIKQDTVHVTIKLPCLSELGYGSNDHLYFIPLLVSL